MATFARTTSAGNVAARTPAAAALALTLFFVWLATASAAAASARNHTSYSNRMVMEPEMVFESDAGRCEMWMADKQQMLMDAGIEGARMTLRLRGLMLPMYSDSSLLMYCTRGWAMMGMLMPNGMGMERNYRMIEKGMIVAVPKGMIFWMYNMGYSDMEPKMDEASFSTSDNLRYRRRHGGYMGEEMEQEEFEMVMMADTSMAVKPGQCTSFHLAGAKKSEMGGIMHGFSKDMLADAWDVKEEVVHEMVGSQDGTALVRLSKGHPFHDLMCREASHMMRMHKGMRIRRINDAAAEEDVLKSNDGMRMPMSVTHFMYDMEHATCDYYNSRGGCMTVLNRYRMPVLKGMRPQSGMGATSCRLEPEAMLAPGYMGNGHQMVYCMRGKMRMQVVKPNGERWCDEEMQEGDMMMIPMGYPTMMKAGSDGCRFMSFITSDMPMPMFMAGRDSVLAMMPQELVMAAFGVDDKVASLMSQRRGRHAAILSPGRREEFGNAYDQDHTLDAGVMEAVLQSLIK